jgi:hypothetical protein
MKKEAYPHGLQSVMDLEEPEYNKERWLDTLKKIYASTEYDTEDLVDKYTKDWEDKEKEAFRRWMEYYEDGEHKKYNVRPSEVFAMEKEAQFLDKNEVQTKVYHLDTFQEKASKRLEALSKMIREYRKTLGSEKIEFLLAEINKLRTVILQLTPQLATATIKDVLIRTGNLLQKNDIKEGASIVKDIIKDAEICSKTIIKEGVAADTARGKLENVFVMLGQKRIIRELQKAILLLDQSGVAGSYPELDSAQSKLVQAYSSAATSVNDVLQKMRSLEEYRTQRAVPKGKAEFDPGKLKFVEKGQ